MESPLQKHHPLRLWELNEMQFEELCRDVWEKETSIRRAENHGRRGQKQRGVDILARRVDGKWSLGSCKNYADFGVEDFDKAVEEFWQYRAAWKRRGAVAFVVFIGSSKRDVQLQAQYLSHVQDFSSEGLDLELLDNRDLTDALRKHPDVGRKHFDSRIQADLYGANAEPVASNPAKSGGDLAISGGLQEKLILEFTAEVEAEIPDLRARARRGEWRKALELVEKRIQSATWSMLSDDTRSKVLKLSAGLHLDANGDLAGAKIRLNLARSVDPTGDFQVLESVIALREGDGEAALRVLAVPLTTDAWNIRLSILINLGRSHELLDVIKAPTFKPSGGTYRVASLASVVMGDFEQAREYSALALQDDPRGFYIRQLAASLKYLEAVLPSFKESRFLGWPVPPKWEFVLSDEKSMRALEEAEAEFNALLGIAEDGHDDRRDLEAWRLGCLANHPGRQEDASAYARTLLAHDPCHLPALAWCLDRGLPFDRNRTVSALEATVETAQSAELVQTLVNLQVLEGNFREGADLLDRHRKLFDEDAFKTVWRHLRIQVAAILGEPAEEAALLDDETDPIARAQLKYLAERVIAAKSGVWSSFPQAALSLFKATNDPKYLFEACETALVAGDAVFAAAHAEELLEQLRSPGSLLVASHSLFSAGQFKAALEVLSRHDHLIGSGEISERLQRVKTMCLLNRGDLRSAVSTAKDLLHKSGTFDSKWVLFATQVEAADFRGGAETARSLVGDPETTSGHLIHIAGAMWMTDPHLASLAYDKAIEKGIPDRFLAIAASLGYRLGKDKAASPLLQKMLSQAGKPGSSLTVLRADEVQKMDRQKYHAADRFLGAYKNGDIPLHLAYPEVGPPVIQLWLGNHRDVPNLDLPSGLIRSGVHSVRKYEIGAGELFMDVSALMVADQLGMLGLVESTLGPILVSQQSISTLRELAAALTSSHPRLDEASKQVAALVQEQRITLFDASLFDGPKSEDQKTDENPTLISAWICKRNGQDGTVGTTRRADDRVLFVDGLLAVVRGEHSRTGDSIGTGSEPAVAAQGQPRTPADGDLICLDSGVAELLATEDLLAQTADRFQLRIEKKEHLRIVAKNAENGPKARYVQKAIQLVEHVCRGIEQGVLRVVQRDEAIAGAGAAEFSDSCGLGLYDMGLAASQGCKFVWCDDRFVTSFANYESASIAGVSEILDLLRRRLVLSKEEYFRAVFKLRELDYRYIPTSEEEVIWALRTAKVEKGRLLEGPELKTLRRSLATCALDAPSLKSPDGNPVGGLTMEYQWIADTYQATTGAIAELWEDESIPDEELRAKSDYLLGQLVWPLLAPIEVADRVPNGRFRTEAMASAAASLFARGLGLDSRREDPGSRNHRRARFNDWVASQLLDPLVAVEPEVIRAVAKIEAQALEGQQISKGGQEEEAMKGFLLRTILDLPDVVKQEVGFSEEFKSWLKLLPGRVHMNVWGAEFDAEEFWGAAAEAARSGQGSVHEQNGNRIAILSRIDNRKPWKRLRFALDGLPLRGTFRNDGLAVALLPRDQARRYLERRPDWFDVDDTERKRRIRRITAERNVADRVAKFFDQRESSLEVLYSELRKGLKGRTGITTEDLIPRSLEALGNHLRISRRELESGKVDLEQCASRLVEDVGLPRAVQRLIQLPIPLPGLLLEKFKDCSAGERKAVLARIERTTRSPLGLIQAVQLFAVAGEAEEDRMARAEVLVARALKEEGSLANWKLFHSVLTWAFAMLGAVDCFREVDDRLRLLFAWLHAGRVTDVFLSNGSLDLKRCEGAFLNDARLFGLEIGGWNELVWEDCMHPRFAERCPVLVAALASALRGLNQAKQEKLRVNDIFGIGKQRGDDVSITELFKITSNLRNRWGSFLGGEGCVDFRGALGQQFSPSFEITDPVETVSFVLDSLEVDPMQPDAWAIFYVLLGDLPMSEVIEQRLGKLVLSSSFDEIVEQIPGPGLGAMMFAANRTRLWSDPLLSSRVEGLVAKYQRRLMEGSVSSSPPADAVNLLSYYVGMAVVPGDEAATYARFFDYLTAMVRAWPESATIFDNVFWGWPNKWPIRRQNGYWKFALTNRAIR